jgi:predicted permease
MSLESLVTDLRYAARTLRRSPGFTAVSLATLSLGLGATTTIFSIVNGVLLQPLAFYDPARLVVAENIPAPGSRLTGRLPLNARHISEWRTHCQTCAAVALFQGANLTLVGAGEPVRLPGLEVSANFFRTLGVQPVIGRDFLAGEEGVGSSDKVILTDALWRSRFGGDPSAVGRRIQIDGTPSLVVGIMPPALHLPQGEEWGTFVGPPGQPAIFRPLATNIAAEIPEGSLNFSSVIRLKPGAGTGQAVAELNGLLAGFVRQYKLQTRIGLTPLAQEVIRNDRGLLLLLFAGVAAVLLIVCANIGNLMLVRTAGRYREAALRLALGVSRPRLFRIVLLEAAVLVLIGSATGLASTVVALKAFVAQAPVAVPRLDEVHLDWRALLFSALAATFATLMCGMLPAWRMARVEPQEALKAGAANLTGRGPKAFREIVVGLEVALSAVLLIAGSLLIASFVRLMRVDRGVEVDHVLTQEVSFLSPKYANGSRWGFIQDTLDKLSHIPGVRAAGAVSQLPLLGEEWVGSLRDPDRPQLAWQQNPVANFRFVTPGYFPAMGILLRQGRWLEATDRNRAVAVVSESAAGFLWGRENPIGKHVRGAGPSKPALEVVGVVGEVRGKLQDAPPMMVYEHFGRLQPSAMSFVLRAESRLAPVTAATRSILASADPEMAFSPAHTMRQILNGSVASRRFQMYLAATFALSALALSALGIYGVVSFSVARRTPEIGIRMALGASTPQILNMVVRQGMFSVTAGLAAGMACSVWVNRLIASQLFGVAANDITSFAGVGLLLFVVGVCACWIPAHRATRIDPLAALRLE